ncbi:MAG: DUF6940 family protein [Nannocystales bacterium]
MALIRFETLSTGVLRMQLETPGTVREVLHALRDDGGFRSEWNEALAAVPLQSFRWEMPRITTSSLDEGFEAVVVDDPGLNRRQRSSAFAEHFEANPTEAVLVIPNLGGDAILVVPSPAVERDCYCHLADFVRDAPAEQRDALWHRSASATLERAGDRPAWLSTAGGGVPWLHVRLDDRPKYYAYRPYKA